MSGFQPGDHSDGFYKMHPGAKSEMRPEFADRVERRHLDVLYASIDFLNYLVLKLFVVVVVSVLHMAP